MSRGRLAQDDEKWSSHLHAPFRPLSRMGEGWGEGDEIILPRNTHGLRSQSPAWRQPCGCRCWIPLTLSLSQPGEGTHSDAEGIEAGLPGGRLPRGFSKQG